MVAPMLPTVRSIHELGEAVRAERLRQKLSQTDLARKASVRQPLISDLENGATRARMDTVFKVLAALSLDLSIVPRRKPAFDPKAY